ncbi:MAG: hypothetical protein WBG82_03655 [Parvibaculum sp.]|uniref:hypothetical protein n=1 Tax=Parvibaculum sp. TaxID=2024848 RepID=UPI003C71FB0B
MEDSSIYRDFNWAADHAVRQYHAALPYLVSDGAIRLYILFAAFSVLALSVWLSYRSMSKLKGIEEDVFAIKRRGPKPTKPASIDAARDRLNAFRKVMWRAYFLTLLVFVISGFLIPSTGLYLSGVYYKWLDPMGAPFVSLHGGDVVTSPHDAELALFVVNQLTHGALMDFLEVFHVDFGAIANNPENYLFSFAVLTYRSFVGTFAFALLFFLRRAIVIAWQMPTAEELYPTPDKAAAT